MQYTAIKWDDLGSVVMLCRFGESGNAEFHASIELHETFADTATQYARLESAIQRLIQLPLLKASVLVWKRFFMSDSINQAPYVKARVKEAVSAVQQPPLNRSKASLLLYFVENSQMTRNADDTAVLKRQNYEHLFSTQLHRRMGNVNEQTRDVFEGYGQSLMRQNCTLDKNCIRTWIFVQDIDIQYTGMVNARKEHFEKNGLNNETHYLASTGIEGRYIYPEVLMSMDAYAVAGIRPQQIKYLKAPTHLNPTYEYGVTFERGTAIDYGDRRHIFISGTASINNKGEIVHPYDVEKQTERTIENIRTLLSEAGAGLNDIVHMIVYLRDTADYCTVRQYMERHYPDIPRVMVCAPVCRPGWLVEVECMAIKATDTPWPDF